MIGTMLVLWWIGVIVAIWIVFGFEQKTVVVVVVVLPVVIVAQVRIVWVRMSDCVLVVPVTVTPKTWKDVVWGAVCHCHCTGHCHSHYHYDCWCN